MIRILLAAAMLTAALGAQAQPFDKGDGYETRTIAVEAADLDLSTNAGMTTLDKRIRHAVERICASDRACRDEAWASTQDQVAWAVSRDQWMRRLAEERAEQIRTCGWNCPAPAQVYYPAPLPPPPAPGASVVVIITHSPPPPPVYYMR
ncbi:UrcA family protein [Sphingomonas sp. G-3-2-10]|uniref:UrcA family protein n=1 Tax=Sphingomonas sp. G-3-2-10 TaxID=2728838 RepID=UPI00146E2B0F|nr:UrcA family protein [Sphingomonas sp. G-3-2-10]NML06513.1 UrcA family protein [Sphingomonas sp. G-3-2-10]